MDWLASLSYVGYSVGAILCSLAALWVGRRGAVQRTDRYAAIVALVLTANWCFAAASFPSADPLVQLAEIARTLSWLFFLFRLFGNDGRDEGLRLVRPALIALAFVVSLQFVLLYVMRANPGDAKVGATAFEISTLFRMMVAVGALVLIHNLYIGAAPSSRLLLRWPAAALAGMWAYDLNLYTVANFVGALPDELVALRGFAAGVVALPIAFGFAAQSAEVEFRPSRAVTFRFLSLLLIGLYLALMLAIARWVDMLTGDMARLTQVGLLIAAGALMLIWLPSKRLRGWLRVTAVKHLFKHRYDYRNEWIRFTNTIGRTGFDEASLQERVVKAIADITDSPSGLLLTPDEDGALELNARWRWKGIEVPAQAMPLPLAMILEREGLIVDFDEIRSGVDHYGEQGFMPAWLRDDSQVWAAVPLLHFDRLVGVVVLARPLLSRKLDWEDFDLLGVVGRQLASYLAEEAGQSALLEASRFDEFNRRIAFVLHDIKNLSSQMSLLMRNAEKHADKPEFRQDMLVTLRNSADKLNALLARLGRYGGQGQDRLGDFDLATVARGLGERFKRQHPVSVLRSEAAPVTGDPEALDQALAHLIQNAIEASAPTSPVMIEVFSDGISGKIQVIDNGHGMSPQFIRSKLFKPFVSSKDGGFGIGAFEAREMVRAMGGRLDVESREGLGTRFTVSLPLQATARMIGPGRTTMEHETI